MENLYTWKDDELLDFYATDFINSKSETSTEKYSDEHKDIVLKRVNDFVDYSELRGNGINALQGNHFTTRLTQYFKVNDDFIKCKRHYIFKTKIGLLFNPITNKKSISAYGKAILDFQQYVDKHLKELHNITFFGEYASSPDMIAKISLTHLTANSN
ncbi:MAG: hypothetical protein ABI855_20145 [Bacteroidota bacterium]